MKEYGYIDEFGFMTSKNIDEYKDYYKDETGELKERIISVEEQATKLIKKGWKPVDQIDEDKMQSENGFYIKLVAFDAGDRISYRYEKLPDITYLQDKIRELKNLLNDSDFKIIKCYEANLLNKSYLPYNAALLHEERQAIRDEINVLEDKLIYLTKDVEN